jgi:4-amino-4-deoxy-L-arabinose transferase-like glycosyltransferase
LGLLALLLFVVGHVHHTAIGFDSRFVMFAQEMLRNGPSFFPTTYGEPYPDYSATSTFFVYLLSLPFGQVNSLTAWLPTAIASATVVVLMYRLLAPYSQRWALASLALMTMSLMFVSETRAVSLDQMLAAVAFAVFYLAYAADHFAAPRRLGWVFVLLALGFAIRGPIGLVIPTGMLCGYYLVSGQWRRLFAVGFAALVLLALGIGLTLWLARLSGGDEFVQDVIRMQVVGRIDGSEGASGPFYYFSSSLGNYAPTYPLALLTLAVLACSGKARDSQALRLLAACAVAGLIVLVGLSIPMAKKSRYVLAMLPMAAVVAGYSFHVLSGRGFKALRVLIQALWLILPGALIAGLCVAQRKLGEPALALGWVLGLLAVLQVLALATLLRPRWRSAGLGACAAVAVWLAYVGVVEPLQYAQYDTRQFSQAAYERIRSAPAPLVMHGLTKDGKAIKFMVNIDADVLASFTRSADQLQAQTGPAYVVVSQQDWLALPASVTLRFEQVLQGQFDKQPYLLMYLPR